MGAPTGDASVQKTAEKGRPNGYPSLDASGKVPATQIPATGGGVPATRSIATAAPLTGGGDLSADRTHSVSDFVASGAAHARGTVPDPGAAAGSTKFLREDATWQVPAGGGAAVAPSLNRTFALMGA